MSPKHLTLEERRDQNSLYHSGTVSCSCMLRQTHLPGLLGLAFTPCQDILAFPVGRQLGLGVGDGAGALEAVLHSAGSTNLRISSHSGGEPGTCGSLIPPHLGEQFPLLVWGRFHALLLLVLGGRPQLCHPHWKSLGAMHFWSSHANSLRKPVGTHDCFVQAYSAQAKARVFSCLTAQNPLDQRHQCGTWNPWGRVC